MSTVSLSSPTGRLRGLSRVTASIRARCLRTHSGSSCVSDARSSSRRVSTGRPSSRKFLPGMTYRSQRPSHSADGESHSELHPLRLLSGSWEHFPPLGWEHINLTGDYI